MKRKIVSLLLVTPLLFPVLPGCAGRTEPQKISTLLESRGGELVSVADSLGKGDGPSVFRQFSRLVTEELNATGGSGTASDLRRALEGSTDPAARSTLAWMVHTFAREFYGDEIIGATSELIRFRTFATNIPNRTNPEFIRQKEFLGKLAEKLGLGFRDADGYVQEISIGEGGEPFGLMVHSDVQPVDEDEWSFDPWSGEVRDGAIRGRGTIDDKGALIAIMYGMRALLDSGVPVKNRIILLVGTDEESANEDISTYLKTNEAPSKTVVVDYAYPVYCAEKGWCGVWMKAANGEDRRDEGLVLTGIQSGFSPSIVPGSATATFRERGVPADSTVRHLRESARRFMNDRPGARLDVGSQDDAIVVSAAGRSVHSSVPETGHNALMDLLVWIDKYADPVLNNIALMAKFGSSYIGFELDGRSLGIAHTDSFMGNVSVAGNMFHTDSDSSMFMFNFRIPKGIDPASIRATIEGDLSEFSERWKIRFSPQMYLSEPFYRDPDIPFVHRLLGIYTEVTGEATGARSMGGGTYARRIPNAVVFGPGLDGDEYRGHQPDEYFTLDALKTNIEVLTHTIVEFGLE